MSTFLSKNRECPLFPLSNVEELQLAELLHVRPRGRLARQLLIESLIFAVLGAIGGLVIAQWSSQALVAQLSTPVQQIALDLSFDWRVMAFTAGVALVTASIFGTVPAFRSTRIAPLDVLKVRAQAYSLESANPRHEHEWMVWKDVKLPDGKIIIPGVIDSTSNFVEHPELVADRITQYARVVGKENVIGGVDCGHRL